MRVKKALKAYEQYVQLQLGKSDVDDSYALLSELSHPNSACFTAYTQIIGREVHFVPPSTDSALLGEEVCLIHLVLFLDALLRLGKETNVRLQLRSIIDTLSEAKERHEGGKR